MLRTLLVEPDHLFHRLFEAFLNSQSEMCCVGIAKDGISALELCRSLQPEVVVIEVDLPDLDGVDVIRTIRREFPETVVLIFSSYLEDYAAGMRAGAATWVMKGAGPFELVDKILQYGSRHAVKLQPQ